MQKAKLTIQVCLAVKKYNYNYKIYYKYKKTHSAAFLIELSSSVRSLSITQFGNESATSIFLGARNVDWAPVFAEMFSRKLDKMRISNNWNFLGLDAVDYITKVW